MNDIYQGYVSSGNDNAVSYLVDSLMHTYTLMDMVYHATSEGPYGGGDDISMIDWMAKLPLKTNETISSVCNGPVVEAANRPKVGTKYCDSKVSATSYTQK